MIQPSELTVELDGPPSPAVLDLIRDYGGSYTDPDWGNQAVFPSAWHCQQFLKALQHLQEAPDGQ